MVLSKSYDDIDVVAASGNFRDKCFEHAGSLNNQWEKAANS